MLYVVAGGGPLHPPHRPHLVPGIAGPLVPRLFLQHLAQNEMVLRSRQKAGVLPLPALMGLDQEIDSLFQVLPLYDTVNDAMLHQKLRSLKALRQLLTDGLPNDSGPGKSDQRARLRHDHIPKHGEAGSHASRGGIREHGAVQQPGLPQLPHGRRSLGHLHQGDDALLHSGASRTAEQKDGQPSLNGPFNGGSDLLPHHMAHAGHEKSGVTDPQHHVLTEHLALSHRHRFLQTCLFSGSGQLFLISFIVQRIGYGHIRKPRLKAMRISDHTDAVVHFDPEIPIAFIADIFPLHHPIPVHRLPALRTAYLISFSVTQILRLLTLFLGGLRFGPGACRSGCLLFGILPFGKEIRTLLFQQNILSHLCTIQQPAHFFHL